MNGFAGVGLGDLRAGFTDPPRSVAPRMRWWWFGPSVRRAELERELTAMAAAGLGGAEVAYVYPLGAASTTFGSETFLSDLRFAAERARDLGLGFDLTLGSGWSFGGPHIPDTLAARQLSWERREIGPDPLDLPAAAPWPGDELLAAYVGAGSLQEEPEAYAWQPLVDGRWRIPAGAGPRVLLLASARRTGQNVKRAAVGAEGPVLDHYSAAATQAHLVAVGDPMLAAVPASVVSSVFCDSLEAYEADWTPALPAEFSRRRGYDLLPVLQLLAVDGPGSDRVRADFHRTLVELYEENFVAVCRGWAAGRGVPFRIQGYGTPPARISSYRFADLFEGEGWGWLGLPPTRWASSAAHLYHRPVVSSEVWTWVHSPAFRATPLDLKGEAHEHLLNGVNALVGHGWPYSPADAPGLGWWFYAAGALDDRNPWWPAMAELSRYLSRLCWLLQQGEPVADVAVYVAEEDLFATMGRAQGGSLDCWREASRRISSAVPRAIRAAGLDFDLVDDEALTTTAADRYRVVVLPPGSSIPARTASWLDRVRASGGAVLEAGPVAVDGGTGAVGGLRDALAAALGPDLATSPTAPDLGFVHRHCADSDVYLLVNTGPSARDVDVTVRGARAGVQQWDPRTGQVVASVPGREPVPLTLQPYEATVLVCTDDPGPSLRSGAPDGRILPLREGWRLAYPDEPEHAVDLPHVWEDDPDRRYYSGSATYTTEVDLAAAPAQAWLDFGASEVHDDRAAERGLVGASYRVAVRGPVGEVAQVRVNGVDCGLAWTPPYRVGVGAALQPGRNQIQVTVFNTAANELAADAHITGLVDESEARYGRRFRMQDLGLATATVRSGLLQVPALVLADEGAGPNAGVGVRASR